LRRTIALPRPWRRGERPRLAGVSSFGFSGTNAHVVLEQPPLAEPAAAPSARARVVTLSAKTSPAVRELAARYAHHLSAHHPVGQGL